MYEKLSKDNYRYPFDMIHCNNKLAREIPIVCIVMYVMLKNENKNANIHVIVYL